MVRIEELAKKPAEFQRSTGVNYATFKLISDKVKAYVAAYKAAHPIHQRGRKSSFGLEQSLLLTLMYLRQYHTFLSLGQAFSVSESYAYKRYCYMRHLLTEVLEMPDKAMLLKEGLKKVATDVSEQPVERPVKGQKHYYSGKKKAHDKGPARSLPAHRADFNGALREGENA